jgi:hypothetical protein
MDDGSSAAAEISDTVARHPTHCLWTLNEFYTSVGATSIKKGHRREKILRPNLTTLWKRKEIDPKTGNVVAVIDPNSGAENKP